MFARTIITALALLVGFVASASAQQCRTVYNPQSGQVLERDCSTFQTANQGGNQGQTNHYRCRQQLFICKKRWHQPESNTYKGQRKRSPAAD